MNKEQLTCFAIYDRKTMTLKEFYDDVDMDKDFINGQFRGRDLTIQDNFVITYNCLKLKQLNQYVDCGLNMVLNVHQIKALMQHFIDEMQRNNKRDRYKWNPAKDILTRSTHIDLIEPIDAQIDGADGNIVKTFDEETLCFKPVAHINFLPGLPNDVPELEDTDKVTEEDQRALVMLMLKRKLEQPSVDENVHPLMRLMGMMGIPQRSPQLGIGEAWFDPLMLIEKESESIKSDEDALEEAKRILSGND